MRPLPLLLALVVLAPAASAQDAQVLQLNQPTVVHALAVAQLSDGSFQGSVSTISITVGRGGSGHVFVDTSPLAQVDMQGSARLAVRVASSVTGISVADKDVFFVVRSDATVIGGPSAGGIMTVGAIAALENWSINESVAMTGTINPDGDIGPIGGLLEKISAAAQSGITLFLFPEGQENVSSLSSTGGQGVVSTYDHCARVRIQCIAVGTVEDAARYITGHAFSAPPTGAGPVTSAAFTAVMQPLAANLTANARNLTLNASSHFNRAARNLPSSLRTQLQGSLNDASSALLQAESAFNDGRYYTASSRSYQASVDARGVDWTLSMVEAQDRDAFVQARLQDVQQRAAQAVKDADQPVQGIAHLGGVGAAQERATEAEQTAAQARLEYQQGSSFNALQDAAQSYERSTSVGWWLDIANSLNEPGAQPLGTDPLNHTARDLVDTARETLVYADTLIQESTGQSGALAGPGSPQDLLDRASQDLQRGKFPAAIFEAIQAQVHASSALELLGAESTADAKVARAKDSAASAITQARQDGYEPLLAQSMYEFAGDQTDAQTALSYYNDARNFALLGHSFFAQQSAPRDTKFVGFAPAPAPAGDGVFGASGFAASLLLFAFVLGGALGGALVLLATLLTRAKPQPAPPPPARPPDVQPMPVDLFAGGDSAPAPPPPPAEPAPEPPREPAGTMRGPDEGYR
jgi:uncharacterized protein